MLEPKPEVQPLPSPSWDELYTVAEVQQGCFSREQAREAGFSDQLLQRHLKSGNIQRLYRGIYRLSRFPAAGREQEDLMVIWLWSSSQGVFSHETALQLHDLSDLLPSRFHLTLPLAWKQKSLKAPAGVSLYFADIQAPDRTFVGSIPVTKPARSINDVASSHGDMGNIEAAVRQTIQRGLATPAELWPAIQYLATAMWRVVPEAMENLRGSWRTEVLSGRCTAPPPPDWRVEADAFASSVGGRLRAAVYFAASQTMSIEVIWPEAEPSANTAAHQLRATVASRFQWTE